MQLIEVTTAQLAKDFLLVNVIINKGNLDYIRPLDKDVNEVFDPKKNKAFRFGEAIRWILKDKEGKLIGRIAAYTNKKYKNKGCLLYTSDAADERSSVDLGGRRIIKKKKETKKKKNKK